MVKVRDETEIPGIPTLSASPPTEPVPVLAGPQPPEPGAEGEPKKRRRRAKKPPAPVEAPPDGVSEQDLENCRTALATSFLIGSKVAAKYRGAHWLLEESEAESLGAVWTAALAPYLPKIGAAVPWATALIVTATFVLPRIETDRALAAEQADGAAVPPGPRGVP